MCEVKSKRNRVNDNEVVLGSIEEKSEFRKTQEIKRVVNHV